MICFTTIKSSYVPRSRFNFTEAQYEAAHVTMYNKYIKVEKKVYPLKKKLEFYYTCLEEENEPSDQLPQILQKKSQKQEAQSN